MITIVDVRDAISRIQQQVQQTAEDLCARDGQLGDGDLGITLEKAFNRLAEIAPTLPDDLGKAFAAAAAAISKPPPMTAPCNTAMTGTSPFSIRSKARCQDREK